MQRDPIIIEPRLRVRLPRLDQVSSSSPNAWFAQRFPEQASLYGAAFMEASYSDHDGLTHIVPVYLNDDFFGGVLGGDRRLGHQVVYFQPEDCWYFYDPVPGAFCPTTSAKLALLLSNYLIRCAEDSGPLVDVANLVVAFRKDEILERIIRKAKAMLLADSQFFSGKKGHKRMIDGRMIDPNEEPAYVRFVKLGIVREENARLTVADAFHRYYLYCQSQNQKPLTRQEFKHLVSEVIREQFRIGLRHDVLTDDGKQGHGWYGIDCRLLPRVLLVGDSITRGYYGEVEKRLTGKAYVARFATSRFLADPVFAKELKLILASATFDVIHFNNGMHGWGYTEEEYRQHFPEFISILRQGAPNAKLICATTTPVRLAGKLSEFDPKTERVRVRNEIATEFAAKEKIPVDDLFSLVEGHGDYNDAGGVHFNKEGIQAQGEQVAAEIEKLLPK